jgi:hypothetical protein
MAKSSLGFWAALLGLGPAVAGTPVSAEPDSIVGSWMVIPSAPNRPPGLPNAFTFTSDGTIIRFSPADSGATGAWIDTGNRTVTYTFVALNRGAAGDFTENVQGPGGK